MRSGVMRLLGVTVALLWQVSEAVRGSGSHFYGCGKKPTTRISDAANDVWPWFAQLGREVPGEGFESLCNAVLIADQWLLSAAHCTRISDNHQLWKVRLGFKETGPLLSVQRLVIHPDYGHGTRPGGAPFYHDIALVELTQPVAFTRDISPVCLPWEDEGQSLVGKVLTQITAGVPFGGRGGKLVKQVAQLEVLQGRYCAAAYSSTYLRVRATQGFGADLLVCLGNPQGETDACMGTSGAPLVYPGRFRSYNLAGLVNFGKGCEVKDSPFVGIPVGQGRYLDWIRQHVFVNN